MEAVWRIEVEDFPAFVVVDDKGNDFFAETSTPTLQVGFRRVSRRHCSRRGPASSRVGGGPSTIRAPDTATPSGPASTGSSTSERTSGRSSASRLSRSAMSSSASSRGRRLAAVAGQQRRRPGLADQLGGVDRRTAAAAGRRGRRAARWPCRTGRTTAATPNDGSSSSAKTHAVPGGAIRWTNTSSRPEAGTRSANACRAPWWVTTAAARPPRPPGAATARRSALIATGKPSSLAAATVSAALRRPRGTAASRCRSSAAARRARRRRARSASTPSARWARSTSARRALHVDPGRPDVLPRRRGAPARVPGDPAQRGDGPLRRRVAGHRAAVRDAVRTADGESVEHALRAEERA